MHNPRLIEAMLNQRTGFRKGIDDFVTISEIVRGLSTLELIPHDSDAYVAEVGGNLDLTDVIVKALELPRSFNLRELSVKDTELLQVMQTLGLVAWHSHDDETFPKNGYYLTNDTSGLELAMSLLG